MHETKTLNKHETHNANQKSKQKKGKSSIKDNMKDGNTWIKSMKI